MDGCGVLRFSGGGGRFSGDVSLDSGSFNGGKTCVPKDGSGPFPSYQVYTTTWALQGDTVSIKAPQPNPSATPATFSLHYDLTVPALYGTFENALIGYAGHGAYVSGNLKCDYVRSQFADYGRKP